MVKIVSFILCVLTTRKKKNKGLENTEAVVLISDRADWSEGSYPNREAAHTMTGGHFSKKTQQSVM